MNFFNVVCPFFHLVLAAMAFRLSFVCVDCYFTFHVSIGDYVGVCLQNRHCRCWLLGLASCNCVSTILRSLAKFDFGMSSVILEYSCYESTALCNTLAFGHQRGGNFVFQFIQNFHSSGYEAVRWTLSLRYPIGSISYIMSSRHTLLNAVS